jgi:mRNA-degrading endonuclease RelE of RelBE toxin-antitoxin system
VISHTTEHFRKQLLDLPKETQRQVREAYAQFKKDPYHPGLHFKRVHSKRPIYAVRISKDYRALGIQQESEIIWFSTYFQ